MILVLPVAVITLSVAVILVLSVVAFQFDEQLARTLVELEPRASGRVLVVVRVQVQELGPTSVRSLSKSSSSSVSNLAAVLVRTRAPLGRLGELQALCDRAAFLARLAIQKFFGGHERNTCFRSLRIVVQGPIKLVLGIPQQSPGCGSLHLNNSEEEEHMTIFENR